MSEAEELEARKIAQREARAIRAAFEAVAAWVDDGAIHTPDDVGRGSHSATAECLSGY